jgi:hypothetical protein
MNNEIWKDIKNYESFFQISNFGRVKSLERFSKQNVLIKEKILKQYKDNKGYKTITLRKNGKRSNGLSVHRLVALHFINNPQNKPEVNHIDGDKTNNHVDNLEWVTKSENHLHAHKTGLHNCYEGVKDNLKKGTEFTKKRVRCIETNEIFESAAAADRYLGFKSQNVSVVARGGNNQKTAGGYHWEYTKE